MCWDVLDASSAEALQVASGLVSAGLRRDFTDLKAAMTTNLRQVVSRAGARLRLDRDGAVAALRAMWTDDPAAFDFFDGGNLSACSGVSPN